MPAPSPAGSRSCDQEQPRTRERLAPLLAGVLELLPWIHQWHPESDPLFGGPPGAFFESWLDGELAALGVTRETLRAWRPPAPTREPKGDGIDPHDASRATLITIPEAVHKGDFVM